MKFEVGDFDDAVRRARQLAEEKLKEGDNADEFVELGEADGFKFYVTAGKTVKESAFDVFHENPRDTFILVLESETEFTFEDGEKAIAKKGQFFVFPKNLKHRCVFKKMTIAVEGVYEKGL